MKKIILLLFIVQNAFAQINTKDALLKIYNYTSKDTIKVEMIVDYCVANTFSNSDKILELAKQAFDLSKELKYKTGEIRALNCLGNYYYQQAIYEKATHYYTQALSLAEKQNDVKDIVIGKNNLANIYTRTLEPKKALTLLIEADEILKKIGQENSQNRAAILTNIGGLFSSLKNHNEAIKYHKKTLTICENLKIPFGIAIASVNIGEEYVTLKQYDKATVFLLKAKVISEKEGYESFLGQVFKNLGIVNWHLNQKEKAFELLDKAVAVCEKINEQNELIKTLEIQQSFYAQNNDFKNAYNIRLKLKVLNQNLYGFEKEKVIQQTKTKYETEKKENQIKLLKKDNQIADLKAKKQKTIVLLLLFLLITILTTGYFGFKRYKTRKQNELLKTKLIEANKTIVAEKKASQSELKAIKAQMNPHFFFNALNTIQSYIVTNETEEASEYLNKFSKLTRMILEMTDKNWISIDEEIKMQSLYLNLQKTRLSNFDFHINMKNDTIHNATIPTMLLQPYIENAVIHGLAHKVGVKNLWLSFEITPQNQLEILIKDNGVGLTKANEINSKDKYKNTSFATKATLERLEIINRNDLKIAIETNELFDNEKKSEGTEIKITMDLHYD